MHRPRTTLAAAILIFLSFLVATEAAQSVRVPPRLILVLSVDQMRYEYLTRFRQIFKGGFRKLLDQGAVFSNAFYRHANSETGPGHSVILSGRHASHSGIVANTWFDPFLKKAINVVDDPVHLPVGGPGRSASPANFIGFTVGDVLKQHSPKSKVVGVSLKDRSAILMAGPRGDAAFWFETEGGNFITSTYYMSEAPAWLVNWNRLRAADRYAGQKWTRLFDDDQFYEKNSGKDAIEGEWDRKDIVFPHLIRGNPPDSEFYDELRRTPWADDLTAQVALEALKAYELGRDDAPDILALGLSATDVIGHTYGADSQEAMDQLLRLDIVLNDLFKEIASRVGMDRTLVILTADHGSMPLVEVLQARGITAQRVPSKSLLSSVNQALAARFPGVEGLVAMYDPPNFYLNEGVILNKGLKRDEVEATVVTALMNSGVIEVAYTQSDMLKNPPPDRPFFKLFRNSFYQPRSPHVLASVKKHIYLDDRPGGTGHGTPHEYDRHVPIIFMGESVKPGLYPELCGPEDIAPTLAKMLGFPYPCEEDSRLLLEMSR